MLSHRVPAGTSISQAIADMMVLANTHDDSVSSEFNDVALTVRPGDDAGAIESGWRQEMDRRAQEYRNSPQGKQAKIEIEQFRLEQQEKVDRLMAELPSLDFSDLASVIDWMERLTDPSNTLGVVAPGQSIIAAFREYGYEPNVNTDDAFDGDDRDNFARYIIGQGLDCLASIGAIFGMFHRLADEWREKFSSANV